MIASSPMIPTKRPMRPSTPVRRRSLATLTGNCVTSTRLTRIITDSIDCLRNTDDSSTQLLIRLYHYKSIQLQREPEKFFRFQQELLSGLRRLHPTVVDHASKCQENDPGLQPTPIVTCRLAQATIRKLI
jgi:hypothetical protein